MPHIKLNEGIPGILGPMLFRPEIAKPLNELAEVLLRGPNSLSPGGRELIGEYTVYKQPPWLTNRPRDTTRSADSRATLPSGSGTTFSQSMGRGERRAEKAQ